MVGNRNEWSLGVPSSMQVSRKRLLRCAKLVTAKRGLAPGTGQPVMHGLLTGLGTLFIERFDLRRSTDDVNLMAAALQRGG